MHLLLRLNWISLFWLAKETEMCLHCNICVWSSKSYLSFSVACFELTVLKKERDGISAAPKKLSPEWGRIRNLGWTGYRLSPSHHPHLYLSLAQMSPVSSLRFIFLSSGFFFFFFPLQGPTSFLKCRVKTWREQASQSHLHGMCSQGGCSCLYLLLPFALLMLLLTFSDDDSLEL